MPLLLAELWLLNSKGTMTACCGLLVLDILCKSDFTARVKCCSFLRLLKACLRFVVGIPTGLSRSDCDECMSLS